MKPNLFRTIILPLLRRGLGGGVLLLPVAAFAQDLTVCAGKGYTLRPAEGKGAAGIGTSSLSYTWYEKTNTGNFTEQGNSNMASWPVSGKSEAGTYSYVRMATNKECPGWVPSNTYTVVVYANPTINTHPAATSTCAGGTVTLSVAANNVTAYQWKNGTKLATAIRPVTRRRP